MLHKKGLTYTQKTLDALIEKTKMENEVIPVMITDKVVELLQSGFLYIGGRDRHFRPYTVITPKKLFDSGADAQTAIAAIVAFFNFTFNHMHADGHIENVVNIIN